LHLCLLLLLFESKHLAILILIDEKEKAIEEYRWLKNKNPGNSEIARELAKVRDLLSSI